MIESGEGWTLLWGFWDASGHVQVMVLPWNARGKELLWESTSNSSGLHSYHLETRY